jgi:acetyltransferase-like isoleucine patch superfamily enzyme
MLVISNAHADFVRSEEGFMLREDVLCWGKWYDSHAFFQDHSLNVTDGNVDSLIFLLNKLFVMFAEFRSLFDYRLGSYPHLRWHKADTLRRATELHIECPVIGPRFRIQHGHNTYVFAQEVGSDFWVNHNVTIGASRGIPRIGNRVTVRTGAVVVGPITVGDDVLVTANAVVATDLPSGHAAYAPRTLFRPRKGSSVVI